MQFLIDLWLPIVVSAVFVFIASSIVHMCIPMHKGDHRQLPGEEKLLADMRAQGLAPGDYMFPFCSSMKGMGTPEMIEKYKQGPVGFITVLRNGPPAIGMGLVQWFIYSLLISTLAGYVTMHGLGGGAHYLAVFRIAGTCAILAYALGPIPNSIWKGCSWTTTAKFVFDGVVYGLVTAGTFGWLWPQAA